jgi:hypothetical protein
MKSNEVTSYLRKALQAGEKPIEASPHEYDQFMKGLVWSDIEQLQLERLANALELLTTTEDLYTIAKIQGQIHEIQFTLTIPHSLRNAQIADDDDE